MIQAEPPIFYFDEISSNLYDTIITGWLAIPGCPAWKVKMKINLSSGKNKFSITPSLIVRYDVTKHINQGKSINTNYDHSGFKILLPNQSVPKGKYKISFEVELPSQEHSKLEYTSNKYVFIK